MSILVNAETRVLVQGITGRIGVDEDVPVVERGDQSGSAPQQHAVAEHVTAHVSDAHHTEFVCGGMDPKLL